MKCKVFNKNLILALVLMALALTAGPSFAASYDLAAVEAEWTPPGSTTPIPMWGFISDTGACPPTTPPVEWDVGPLLDVLPGDTTLTINLRNCLSEEVSIVIPGQAAIGTPVWDDGTTGPRTSLTQRVRSLAAETPPDGTTVGTYTWTGVKAGTYLYESGTHPAKQVQMGLYGALKVDFAAGTPNEAYDGIPYDTEVVLLYSEIDPALHDPPATAKPTNYKPQYFLVDGQPYEDGDLPFTVGNVSQNTLMRLLNAGLKTHVPTLLGAYMRVIAEDGNLYPYAKEQYSVLLPAGKTLDAIWTPAAGGTYALYDRSLHLTTAGVTGGGMLSYFDVQGNMPPAITSTPVTTGAEDVAYSYNVEAIDPDVIDTLTYSLDTFPTGMTIESATGLIQWTPAVGDAGDHSVTVRVTDNGGLSATQTFTITVATAPANVAPVALDDFASTTANSTGVIINVLNNDSDPDGTLVPNTVTIVTKPTQKGKATANADGTITYVPKTNFRGTDVFTYTVDDDDGATSNEATVRVNVL